MNKTNGRHTPKMLFYPCKKKEKKTNKQTNKQQNQTGRQTERKNLTRVQEADVLGVSVDHDDARERAAVGRHKEMDVVVQPVTESAHVCPAVQAGKLFFVCRENDNYSHNKC